MTWRSRLPPSSGQYVTSPWFRPAEAVPGPARPGLFDAARNWPLRSEIYVDRAMAPAHLAGEHPRESRAEYEAENPFVDGDVA